MFTRVKISNYKSLINLDVDLSAKKKQVKPLVIIYGENGVGKTNFATVFYTLSETLRTMSIKARLQKLIDGEESDSKDLISDKKFRKFISRNIVDTESIIKNCKTINSCENMVLDFEFVIDSKKGRYLIEYDNSKIVHEKLEYILNKNKTLFFEIVENEIKVNEKIFTNNIYYNEFYDLLEKYNGKHSFLSILVYEVEDKAEGYVNHRINRRLYEVVAAFITMSIRVTGYHSEKGTIGVNHQILTDLDKGEISLGCEEELNRAERMVNEFFTLAYSDIKEAYYKREKIDENIKYNLFFRKKIFGKIIDVDFDLESTGTKCLLQVIPFLLMSVEGQAVIIDELDSGIHDLLINNILLNLSDSIKGQLIITTHNTMFLESDINMEYIYTFVVDKDANKELLPIVSFEDRTHPNLNYRNRYLKGMYGGVPINRDIDFDELLELME